MAKTTDIRRLTGAGPLDPERFGVRAARLSAMAALGAPVPDGVALSVALVRDIAANPGIAADCAARILSNFPADVPLAVRASPQNPAWGGPAAVLNVGWTDASDALMRPLLGQAGVARARFAFVRDYADRVAAMETADFDDIATQDDAVAAATRLYQAETDVAFPWDAAEQLRHLLVALARDWSRPSAKMLRTASGAPEDAGLGLVLHRAVVATTGAGKVQHVDPATGKDKYICNFKGVDGTPGVDTTSLDAVIKTQIDRANRVLEDAARLNVVVEDDALFVVDVLPAERDNRADIQIVVDLVSQGVLDKNRALLRINPQSLTEHMHPQVTDSCDSGAHDILGRGVAASPGAAQGPVVLTAQAAQVAAAHGQRAILVRQETSPEDIRGMNSAAGVITLSGGLSSHAAVIAQGLGVPCVVGARNMRIDTAAGTLITDDGRVVSEGDIVTLNGSGGTVLAGALRLREADLSPAIVTLMRWADEARTIGVRANADTPQDARVAKQFLAEGIGLCRTEHMFYAAERLDVMREMILTEDAARRNHALSRLLPMQRDDFVDLFRIMEGAPVTIRLLDPPLHEFLPKGDTEICTLAAAMNLPEATVRRRIADLDEYNPMLGMRGVRLAVMVPEIYEMQARAIFEAALTYEDEGGAAFIPEIMIPLVSAQREVDLIRDRIDAVAADVSKNRARPLNFKLGVMVETPRAALRSGDLAKSAAFLSFGTNDLTQMTYGLSRDDAGRFMREYVHSGVYPEDPFLTLDVEAVGELLLIAARRGRDSNESLELGLCGEHGGDPYSVRFCKVAGFDYVSCSPFRVAIARLAGAQATLLHNAKTGAETD